MNLINMPKTQAAVKIAREIDNIEKGNSCIVSVIELINTREKILSDTVKNIKKNLTSDINTFTKIIENLREITVKIVENIELWKKENFVEEGFLYKDIEYYEKFRTDTDFFSDSFLNKCYCFYKSDPFFIGPTHPKIIRKKKFSLPCGYKLQHRIQKALEILKFNPIRPLKAIKIRNSLPESEVTLSIPDQIYTDTSQVFSTEIVVTEFEEKKLKNEIAKMFLTDIIDAEITEKLSISLSESFREIITASLTLYSSSILDRIITEVINNLIYSIAKQSYTEVTDSEYIDIRNLIIHEAMEEQIALISSNNTNNVISQIISDDIIENIEFFQIVLQAIEEENIENQKIVFIATDELIEEFFLEEWIEEMAEIELVQEKMENV